MLDFDMDKHGSCSLYEYLYQQIRDEIISGSIGAHEHLPSKRALAEHLGVSVITVENAYDQLVAEGYVYTRPRRGFYACELPNATPSVVHAQGESVDLSSDAGALSGSELIPDALSQSSFEAARLWQRALRQALSSEDERVLFSPASAQGTERLRLAIANHLRGTRGLDVDPRNIVVGAGAQLLDTMLVQLLGHDATYAVEDPGYLRLTRIYQACGCRVRHVPLDGEGPRLDALASCDADVFHLMPSHQFPTGRVTSIARRYGLLAWAAAKPGRYLIEDDYDCEFRLAGRPIPPLAAIDAAGCVIYTNTFSKSLSSALRLAYMVLPPALMNRYNDELGFYSSSVSSIDQIALARLLESGEYERHAMRVRKRAREARDLLREELDRVDGLGEIDIEEADAGLHCVLAVKGDMSEKETADRLGAHGIPSVPLSDFAWSNKNTIDNDGKKRLVVLYEDINKNKLFEQ